MLHPPKQVFFNSVIQLYIYQLHSLIFGLLLFLQLFLLPAGV